MELPVIVVVGEREVVGVVVELNLCAGIESGGNRLVIGHGLSLVALCPVIAVGGKTEYEFVVGDILCGPVSGTLHPVLRSDVAGLALPVVLVIGHEEEVVVVAGERLHIIILIKRCDVLHDIHIVVMEEHGELLDEIGQQGIVVDGEFLQVDVDALEPVAMADGDEGVEELFAQLLVAHDAADTLGTEVIAIVVGEHRHDGHSAFTHGSQCFLVDLYLQPAGLGIDEEPLGDDHVEVLHILLERAQGVCVPVDIPRRAHAKSRVIPFVDKLLSESPAMSDKTMSTVIVFLVGIVHTLFQKVIAQRTVSLGELGVAHERLRGCHHPTVVVAERHIRTALQRKHGDEDDNQ